MKKLFVASLILSLSGAVFAAEPTAPVLTGSTVGSGSIDVTFEPPTATGADVTGYEYQLDGGTWAAASSMESPLKSPMPLATVPKPPPSPMIRRPGRVAAVIDNFFAVRFLRERSAGDDVVA